MRRAKLNDFKGKRGIKILKISMNSIPHKKISLVQIINKLTTPLPQIQKREKNKNKKFNKV